MENDELAKALAELFSGHGLKTASHDGWQLPNEQLPAMRLNWQDEPGDSRVGTLLVQVLLADERLLEDTIVGLGKGPEGCRDALRTFLSGTFHVLLSALWNQNVKDVTRTEISSGSGPWIAHAAGEFFRGSDEIMDRITGDLSDELSRLLLHESIERSIHWFSGFHCNTIKAESVDEALLDSGLWTEGTEYLRAREWPASDTFYSLKSFTVIVPA